MNLILGPGLSVGTAGKHHHMDSRRTSSARAAPVLVILGCWYINISFLNFIIYLKDMAISTLYPYLYLCLVIYIKRESSFICWFTPQTVTIARAGSGWGQEPGTPLCGLSHGWQGPQHLSHYQLPLRVRISRKPELEAELRPEPKHSLGDVGVSRSILLMTHQMPTSQHTFQHVSLKITRNKNLGFFMIVFIFGGFISRILMVF